MKFGMSLTKCFNTQPPEGGWPVPNRLIIHQTVSTHSRPKAAGRAAQVGGTGITRFNTQPPEGGWLSFFNYLLTFNWFQHTAARRRLGSKHRTKLGNL